MIEKQKIYMTDVHMHIVPGVDDGAIDLNMSLEMLQLAYEQGIRNVFCTSHNGYSIEDCYRYKAKLSMLQMCAKEKYPKMNLYPGCELLCGGEYIDDILYGLETGAFLPLGNTEYVLTEFYPDVTPTEADLIIRKMQEKGWRPIIAHVERYPELFYENTIGLLIEKGALLQVNIYSLAEEKKDDIKSRARELLSKQQIHFLGSDSHRTTHRAPRVSEGLRYICQNTDHEYAEAICYKNAEKYLQKDI